MSNLILYACIAKGVNILVEYSMRSGNFVAVINRILGKLTQDDQTLTYVYDGHYFCIKVYNFITYLCLTKEEAGRTLPNQFLNEICNLFDPIKNNIGNVGRFGITLKNKMEIYSNVKYEFPEIKKIQETVDETKNIMIKNIEDIMSRGDQLIQLDTVAEDIEIEAKKFKRGARIVKEKVEQWRILKILLIVGCVIVMILCIFVTWYLVCGNLNIQCGRIPTNGTLSG